MGAGVIGGEIDRLHGQIQEHLVAGGAGQGDPLRQALGIRRKGECYGTWKTLDGGLGGGAR